MIRGLLACLFSAFPPPFFSEGEGVGLWGWGNNRGCGQGSRRGAGAGLANAGGRGKGRKYGAEPGLPDLKVDGRLCVSHGEG